MSVYHTPVLLQESVSALCVNPSGVYVDATFGGGGHSAEILSRLGSKGRLIVIDRDEEALANVPQDARVKAVHGNFRFVHNFIRAEGYDGVDGILADLGVSSHQFDTLERGFSFRFDAGLDMRMNPKAPKDAKHVLNSYSCEDLERIFRVYGELGQSRKIAELICRKREVSPIRTTSELGDAISVVLPAFSEHKFLAKLYQALRIEVNDEMVSLEKFMPMAVKSLNKGGVLAVITYHSLEDRIVKNAIRDAVTAGQLEKTLRKPAVPSEEEISQNTRARSAKLRAARRKTD